MGKGQSKHGQCYLVNAHFNPLCQLEDSHSTLSTETPLTSKDSGLQLTSEISFTLSEENRTKCDKEATAKCALEVFLPEESVNIAVENSAMDLKLKSGGSSTKEEITLECVQDKSEKQEFSFVLRNYTGKESGKDDVEKIVLHSICDALKTSLKLPPSGAHTLKVHLIVSPESEKSSETSLQNQNDHKTVGPPCMESKADIPNFSVKNVPADFVSTEAMSSPTKQLNSFSKCCQDGFINLQTPKVDLSNKCGAFDSPRCKRNKLLAQRKENRQCMGTAESGMRNNKTNVKCSLQDSIIQEKMRYHHNNVRDNIGDSSHYLDLAELKLSDSKGPKTERTNKCDLRYLNPAFCSPKHSDKGNIFCRSHKQNIDFQNSHGVKKNDVYHRLYDADLHSGILRYKLLNKTKNNHLDLSFDLCDIDDKQKDDDLHTQHRRSRSYDTNQYLFVNSPKLKHRNCNCLKCISVLPQHSNIVPPSPSRHHRHRHKEREKDKVRAMQQVACWLEREDLNRAKHQLPENKSWADSETVSQKDTVIEHHEYHHVHEHHHYYHYINS